MNLGDSYLDKEELRRRAPLALVAAELGVSLDERGEALCPFHENDGLNHKPSFRTWVADDGHEKWGCYPCGLAGDVYDLVQQTEGLSFNDALERVAAIVKELPAEAMNRAPAQRQEFDRDACALVVDDARRIAAENEGWLCVAVGLVPEHADADYRGAVDQFLRDELRWGVDPGGNVVMPHYDAVGTLTGAKIRALNGKKWSFPGSHYPALYGSWRPRRGRLILLTEGEGDMAYAAMQSPRTKDGHAVDVLSLPKGATTFLEDWAELEADVYFLAFDADDAGLAATQRWLDALAGREVRVCRLPLGHDLKSARPDVIDMLRNAVRPTNIPAAVMRMDGRFERTTNNGERVLTNWTCEPLARLESVDEAVRPALEVMVHSAGHDWKDVISMDDLHSSSKLRTWAAQRSLDCLASDPDTQYLASLLLAESLILPEIFQTTHLGSHAPPSRYRYTGRTIVAPDCSIGRLPWRYVGPAEANDHVLLCDEGPMDWQWLKAFLELNEPSVTHPLLAWLIATSRRDELAQFPLMFLGGSSGSGKTTTAEIATRLMGSNLGVSLASVTQFALIRELSMSTTLPVFIDEWSLQSRQDARETLQAVIPVIYDGGVTPRGRADLSVMEFRLKSPVLAAGEDSFHLDREADRMIGLRLRVSGQVHVNLQYLTSQPIHRFGRWFSEWLVSAEDLPFAPGKGMTRPDYNRAVLLMGWDTLRAYVTEASERGHDVPELPEAPDFSQLDRRDEDRENEYEVFLAEGMGLRDGDGLPLVWEDPDGRGVWVRFRMLTSPRNISGVDVELPGRSRAMKQYFADRYKIRDARMTPPFATKAIRASLIEGLRLDKDEE